MDVRAAIGDGRTLRRIIALLVSFAAMAERAASRSLPVRCLVLWILRQAEAVAEDYVFDETGTPPSAIAGVATEGFDPADALHLARRLHALAAVLCALLADAYLLGCGADGRSGRRGLASGRGAAPGAGRSPVGWRPEPIDTS